MSKKILIDLRKCRNCEECTVECVYPFHPNNNGLRHLKEIAAFAFTCRKCEEAPCVEVCPADALEKNENSTLEKHNNLCIACKSCLVACPFGTIMDDVLEYKKSICNYCNLNDQTEQLKCIDTCPEKALSLVDFDENEEEDIYKLNDKVLVKEYRWEKLRNC